MIILYELMLFFFFDGNVVHTKPHTNQINNYGVNKIPPPGPTVDLTIPEDANTCRTLARS